MWKNCFINNVSKTEPWFDLKSKQKQKRKAYLRRPQEILKKYYRGWQWLHIKWANVSTNNGNEANELRNMSESFKFGCESFFLLCKFDFLLIGGLPLIPINQLNSVSRKLSFVTQGRKTYWINWNHLKYIKGLLKAISFAFLHNCIWSAFLLCKIVIGKKVSW